MKIRHRRGFPPWRRCLQPAPDGFGSSSLGCDLSIDHRLEGVKQRGKAGFILLQGRQHFHHRLHRGHAMAGRFSSDPIVPWRSRHESNSRQGAQCRVEGHHLAGLGPRSIDHDQRLWRMIQSVWGRGLGTRKQESSARSRKKLMDPGVVFKGDPFVQFAPGKTQMSDARGSDRYFGFSRMLQENDPGGCGKRRQIGAPANGFRATTTSANGSSSGSGHLRMFLILSQGRAPLVVERAIVRDGRWPWQRARESPSRSPRLLRHYVRHDVPPCRHDGDLDRGGPDAPRWV